MLRLDAGKGVTCVAAEAPLSEGLFSERGTPGFTRSSCCQATGLHDSGTLPGWARAVSKYEATVQEMVHRKSMSQKVVYHG